MNKSVQLITREAKKHEMSQIIIKEATMSPLELKSGLSNA